MESAVLSKLLERFSPNMVTAPIIVTAIRVAMRAYSMAVAPRLHLKKQIPRKESRLRYEIIVVIFPQINAYIV